MIRVSFRVMIITQPNDKMELICNIPCKWAWILLKIKRIDVTRLNY